MGLQKALKLLRLELGMTQEDFAARLNKAFVTVNRWENGKTFPSRSNAKDILKIAKDGHASEECIAYLSDVLMPDCKRGASAADYGFPAIDRDFLFQLADGSTNAIYVIDAKTYQLLYVNRRAERFAIRHMAETGQPVTERVLEKQKDLRCFHYFANRNMPCTVCPLARLSGKDFREEIIDNPINGRKYLVTARLSAIQGQSVYIMYLTDMTSRDTERQALYELTNEIPEGVGIYHVYLDGRVRLDYMNRKYYQMLGAEQKEMLLHNGSSNLSVVHPDARGLVLAKFRNAIKTRQPFSVDFRIKLPDQKYHPIHLEARIIKVERDKFIFYCLFHENRS